MTDSPPPLLELCLEGEMSESHAWYRVTDPLNPLYGCDLRVVGYIVNDGSPTLAIVTALRRVDIFVGDRPFQLVAPSGETLGVYVQIGHLEKSPLQDETIEAGTDRPHGLCIDETEMTRQDGVTLRIARYERATQIAVEDAEGELLGTATDSTDFRDHWEKVIIDMFEFGEEVEDIAYALRSN